MSHDPGPEAGLLHAASLAAASRYLIPAAIAVLAVTAVTAAARAGRGGQSAPRLPAAFRARLRLHPGPGFARGRRVLRGRAGLPAARRSARRTRPSLSGLQVLRGHWGEYATFIGWAAHGWIRPARIYGSFEQLLLVIAGPRAGKSAAAAGRVVDAPGPVVTTSIRGDLIEATAALRQRRGQVLVFSPEGGGPYRSTVWWCPVTGCQDLVTAVRRAGYMIEAMSTRGLEDAGFWSDQASMVLASLLHAAALAAGSMSDVYRWILDDSDQPAGILGRHPAAADPAARHLRQYLALPERTRSGIRATLLGALKFMLVPEIAAVTCPPPGASIDLDAFLASRDTMYLVAADAAQSPVPPLFAALLAEITHRARMAAAAAPGGRLDPPLTLELDEAPNIAPVPVAAWATWAAGSGIRMHVCSQSFSQLAERWGPLGAETIWQSCDVKVVYAGTSEEDAARKVSEACGAVTAAPGGAGAGRPVLPFAVLRELPPGRAVVIRGGMQPILVRTERYWRRRDYRQAARAGRGRPLLPPAAAARLADPIPGLLAAAPRPALTEPPAPEPHRLAS